jgi:hypothetical protein
VRDAGIHGLGVRFGALVVALSLSGALPQMGAVAREREHRCSCHHAPGEVCSCPGCRRAAADARRARLAEVPPCHREAALAALASEEREPPAGAAVVTGCCDTPERQWMALQDSSPYLRPGAVVLKPVTADGLPPPTRLLAPREVPREIPTPPPRVA